MDFKLEAAALISKASGADINECYISTEVPPDPNMGDYAFPCFKLAKVLKKAPAIIADELSGKIEASELFEKTEVKGAYINFFTNKKAFVKDVFSRVVLLGEDFGSSDMGEGKTVVVDFSSPNIAKPFHVGHLRSTVIGNAICNIYKKLGYKVVGINHLGDWGTQFGKLIVAYKLWGNDKEIENSGISELMRLYVKFHDEVETTPSLNDDARSYFVKMQEGDSEALGLWKWFYDISIKEFNRVYNMLGVNFDAFTGESFYNDKMDAIVSELKEKKLLVEDDGAMIVPLDEEKMPPCLIIRSDGGTLYATRDITAAIYRKKTYDFCKCIYLTALDQNLHFAQWFEVIRKMGYAWYKDLYHVPFGLVSLESGKLSTRKGNVVLMEELLNEAVSETLKIINEKNPELEDKYNVAKQVGIGAVIFNDLYNGRIKDVVFSWSRMLNFDGETGPYVQYTHARACSILKKADSSFKDVDFSLLSDSASIEIAKLIDSYPDKIKEAAEKHEPSIITRRLVDIAQAFNRFYHDNPILNSDENLKCARLLVVSAVKTTLSSGLSILGIKAPEQM
ncbi:MAG: arginine--tRNA ligase [Lachnospiraceae bacterium]|nr:arginine--tRNA ligase [Lachnospiraceae bacterium]